jgi:hypothetical protein
MDAWIRVNVRKCDSGCERDYGDERNSTKNKDEGNDSDGRFHVTEKVLGRRQ